MSVLKSPQNETEIDLFRLVQIIWSKKITICLIVVISVITMFGFEFYKFPKKKNFLSITEIKPISTFDEVEYKNFNYFKEKLLGPNSENSKNIGPQSDFSMANTTFQNIERSYLINLFIEKLNESMFLEKIIKKSNLINRKDFVGEIEYEKAVSKLAFSIKLLPPNPKSTNLEDNKFWRIQFITDERLNWQKCLQNILETANKEIAEYLKETFILIVKNEKELKRYRIEDVETKLKNTIKKHEAITVRRVVYLREQAKIAREINIANNYLTKDQTILIDIDTIANLPYYLRGYETIEKEIDIILNRVDHKPFADGVVELEKKLGEINTNKDVSRLEILFQQTPIWNIKNFSAAKITANSTYYKNLNERNNLINKLFLTAIFALITGIFFVLIIYLFQTRDSAQE